MPKPHFDPEAHLPFQGVTVAAHNSYHHFSLVPGEEPVFFFLRD